MWLPWETSSRTAPSCRYAWADWFPLGFGSAGQRNPHSWRSSQYPESLHHAHKPFRAREEPNIGFARILEVEMI